MITSPKTRRRWFQFGLGSLLVLFTVVAVACLFLARAHDESRRRDLMRRQREQLLDTIDMPLEASR